MSPQFILEILKSVFDAFNAHDLDRIMSYSVRIAFCRCRAARPMAVTTPAPDRGERKCPATTSIPSLDGKIVNKVRSGRLRSLERA